MLLVSLLTMLDLRPVEKGHLSGHSFNFNRKPAEEMLKVPGVIETVAGYTGNPATDTAPNYEAVCYSRDWVEGVRVIFDDEQVSYTQLLDSFFEAQEPQYGSRQYASIIFPHDEAQLQAAEDWLESAKSSRKLRRDGVSPEMTRIERLSPFYKAEEYHQRYWEKMRPRIAGLVVLLSISTGLLDNFTPETVHEAVHTAASAVALLGMAFVLVERKIDTKVTQL